MSKKLDIAPLPKCGGGSFTTRIDLSIDGKKGKDNFVASEKKTLFGVEEYYGVQQGFSFDWEKCFTADV